MDLDVSMRVTDCPYTVHFYGALFREVSQLFITVKHYFIIINV